MKLCSVPEDHQLGNDALWGRILNEVRGRPSRRETILCNLHSRSKVVKLLDTKRIQLSSVDLVRFAWLDKNDDQGSLKEEDEGRGRPQPQLR